MRKVLIWNTFEIKPTGGPSGYLYNIQQYIKNNKIKNIVFLSDLINIKYLKEKKYKFLFFKLFNKILGKKNGIINILHFIKYVNSKKQYAKIDIDLKDFDFIHFHTTYELTKYYKNLKEQKFNGKIILTTHTPKPTYMEIIEDWNGLNINSIPNKILNKLKEIDYFAFSKSDILLFPDENALEPYEIWDDFQKIKVNKNFVFIPTGINLPYAKKNRDIILKEYDIPNNSFIISYVGRHNKTKGFDLLKQFGEYVLKKYDNIYFLIAGKEEPIKGLSNDRWIEIGWTDDPFSIINASDLFVLPNRKTYFDLILLEAMSMGKPILLSDTGGNKFFKNKNLDLYYFESSNLESMINVFEFNIAGKKFYSNKNRNYIINNLQVSHFIKKYLDFLDNA